jgi:hypothetical protein
MAFEPETVYVFGNILLSTLAYLRFHLELKLKTTVYNQMYSSFIHMNFYLFVTV